MHPKTFQACLRHALILIWVPATEVAGYYHRSLRDRDLNQWELNFAVRRLLLLPLQILIDHQLAALLHIDDFVERLIS